MTAKVGQLYGVAKAILDPLIRFGWRLDVRGLEHVPATGGAIVRAVGVPETQGWYKAELIREDSEKEGEAVFRFVVKKPEGAVLTGTPMSREITAATFLTNFQLESIRTVTVAGAKNARSTRRR